MSVAAAAPGPTRRARLAYQLALAAAEVYRRPALPVTVIAVLTLAGSMFTFGVVRFLRHHGPYPDLSPALHQVDIAHTDTPTALRGQGTMHTTAGWATHTRVSFPEYQILAASGIPTRQTGTFRAQVLLSAENAPARNQHARFVNAPFFDLFAVPVAPGRAFTRQEEASRAQVVVLGQRLAQALFGGRALGRSVLVEGRRFDVVGVVAGDQPFRPTWDISMMDADQDALYLPFDWHRQLRARPSAVVYPEPVGPAYEALFASEAIFVAYWAELPDDRRRADYARYLDAHLATRGRRYDLRAYPEWRATFAVPRTRVAFLSGLTALLLLAAGLSVMRLRLTRRISRRGELGIRRALGASRLDLFTAEMLEAALLAGSAAAAAVGLALPHIALFNRVVADTDIPARLTWPAALIGAGVVFATGIAAALYPAWRIAQIAPGRVRGED